MSKRDGKKGKGGDGNRERRDGFERRRSGSHKDPGRNRENGDERAPRPESADSVRRVVISCSRCSREDLVTSAVAKRPQPLCFECFKTVRDAKGGKGPRARCAGCGEQVEVNSLSDVRGSLYCRDCKRKFDRRMGRGLSTGQQSRTRVSFRVECSSCGKEVKLPYAPRPGVDAKCAECLEEEGTVVLGVTTGTGGAEAELTCDECGRSYRGKPPRHERERVVCDQCLSGIAPPGDDASEGEEVAVDRGVGVLRRKT